MGIAYAGRIDVRDIDYPAILTHFVFSTRTMVVLFTCYPDSCQKLLAIVAMVIAAASRLVRRIAASRLIATACFFSRTLFASGEECVQILGKLKWQT